MAQQNVTSNSGRLLVAESVIDQLTHLAVGIGDGTGPPLATASQLDEEIGRAFYLQRFFVTEDAAGPIPVGAHVYSQSAEATNLIYFRFRFPAAGAQGNWGEMGLFGGNVAFISRGALLVDGGQTGDDRANVDVLVGGGYIDIVNQTLTITCSAGGGSGVAEVSWVSNGPENPDSAVVTLGSPLAIGSTGITLVFTGDGDGVLTQNDVWELRLTTEPDTATFASGGVYDPQNNVNGQVLDSGRLLQLVHIDPPASKGAEEIDVQLVIEVLREE